MKIHANTKLYGETEEKPKETKEAVEAIGDACKYKNCMDR